MPEKKKRKRVPLGQSKIAGQYYDPTTGAPKEGPPQPKGYQIGDVQLTKEEYYAAKRMLGGEAPGPTFPTTPAVEEAVKEFTKKEPPEALRELVQPPEEVPAEEEPRLYTGPELREIKRTDPERYEQIIEEIKERTRGPPTGRELLGAAGMAVGVGAIGPALTAIGVGGGFTIPVSQGALATGTAKTGILAKLTSTTAGISGLAKKLGGGLIGAAIGVFGITKILGLPKARLQSIDTALGQIRETITAPVAAVRNGAITPSEGMEILDDLEIAVNEYEKSLQELSISVRLTTLNREQLDSAQIRVAKLKMFINVGRQDILLVAAAPVPPNQEQMAIMLQELEGGG